MGRKLYWLFVAIVGFAIGIGLAQIYLIGESEFVLILIALIAGLIGALLTLFLQRLAVGAAGFLAGGYASMVIMELLKMQFGGAEWVIYLVSAMIGTFLVAVLFDWALIFLSSLTGASMLISIDIIDINEWLHLLLFVFLFVVGFIIQSARMRGERRRAN
jgi:hypothetical protein